MRSRTVRWLVFVGIVCAVSMAARKTAGQSATPWPAEAAQYKLYMIGNAHIDIPWLWPWPESMRFGCCGSFGTTTKRSEAVISFKIIF